jgi:hypothetical protein
MISQLCGSASRGNSEIRQELHNVVRMSLIPAMIKATELLCRMEIPTIVSRLQKAARAFVALCCVEVLPQDFSLARPNFAELQALCQAVGDMLGSSLSYQAGSQDLVDTEMVTAAMDFWAALRFIMTHSSSPGINYEGQAFIYQPLNSVKVVLACLTAVRLHPRTNLCLRLCTFLVTLSNHQTFCECLMHDCKNSQSGAEMIIDAVSSLSHDDACVLKMINALSNFSQTGSMYSYFMVQKKALDFLQPCILHTDEGISGRACKFIAILACNPDLGNDVEKSEVLPVVESFWRSRVPGKFRSASQYDVNDVPIMLKMISKDAHSSVQLTGLHTIAATLHLAGNKTLFGHQQFISLYRSCANSRDAFVYIAAVSILREYELAIPNFTLSKADAG